MQLTVFFEPQLLTCEMGIGFLSLIWSEKKELQGISEVKSLLVNKPLLIHSSYLHPN